MVARTAGTWWYGPVRGTDFYGTDFFGTVRGTDKVVRIEVDTHRERTYKSNLFTSI